MRETSSDHAHLQDAGQLACTGVFDLKWQPHGQQSSVDAPSAMAALALADGSCTLLRAERDRADTVHLSMPARSATSTAMCLFCDWLTAQRSDELITSYSDGTAKHLAVREASVACQRSWQAHDIEAWVAIADPHQVWRVL